MTVIKDHNKLMHKSKLSSGTNDALNQQFGSARINVKNVSGIVKVIWIKNIVEGAKDINTNLKKEWKYVIIFVGELNNHYVKNIVFKFRDENRLIDISNNEKFQLESKHIEKIFNRDSGFDWEHASRTK